MTVLLKARCGGHTLSETVTSPLSDRVGMMRKLEDKCLLHKGLNSAKQGSHYGSISLLEEGEGTPLWLPGATGQRLETRGRVGPCS